MNIQKFDYSTDVLAANLWQYDNTKNLLGLIKYKQAWLDQNQTLFWEKWYNNVFNLASPTITLFGLSVWSIILNVPLFAPIAPVTPEDIWGFNEFVDNTRLVMSANATASATESITFSIPLTGTLLISNSHITGISSTINLSIGMDISDGGVNIPSGTTILSIIDEHSLIMSANATASATESITFSITLTGTLLISSPIITGLSTTSFLSPGMNISDGGVNIPGGTTILSVNGYVNDNVNYDNGVFGDAQVTYLSLPQQQFLLLLRYFDCITRGSMQDFIPINFKTDVPTSFLYQDNFRVSINTYLQYLCFNFAERIGYGTNTIVCLDNLDMTVTYHFSDINAFPVALYNAILTLDLWPRPAGVSVLLT